LTLTGVFDTMKVMKKDYEETTCIYLI